MVPVGGGGCKPKERLQQVSFLYAYLQRLIFIATNRCSTLTKTAATCAFISGVVQISCSLCWPNVLMHLHCFIRKQNKTVLQRCYLSTLDFCQDVFAALNFMLDLVTKPHLLCFLCANKMHWNNRTVFSEAPDILRGSTL